VITIGLGHDFIIQKAAQRMRDLASGVEASSSMGIAKLGGRN
jgi:hypothetical protein